MIMGGFSTSRAFVYRHCVKALLNRRWNKPREHRVDYGIRDNSLTHGVAGFADFQWHVEEDGFHVAVVEPGSIYVGTPFFQSDIRRIHESHRTGEFESTSK